jgi:hypothetical protein
MLVDYPAGARDIKILHPFLGINNWHRSVPEAGIGVVLSQRGDSQEPEATGYYRKRLNDAPSNSSGTDVDPRISDYEEGVGVYRTLQPGEQEISSVGLAQSYWANRPILEQRGGVARNWLDQDRMEAGQKAPTHSRLLHKHESHNVNNMERFGVVKRPRSGSRIYEDYVPNPLIPLGYAKEYMRVVGSDLPFPDRLIDQREGHVIEDDKSPASSQDSGDLLRYRKQFYTKLGDKLESGVDQSGNWYVKHPLEALTGGFLDVPAGSLRVNLGQFYELTSNTGITMSTKTDAKMEALLTAKVLAPIVKLGIDPAAIHPLFMSIIYRTAETVLNTGLTVADTTQITARGSAVGVLGAGFTAALQAIMKLPVVPGPVLFGLFTALQALLIAVWGADIGAFTARTTARSTFTGAYDTYLSKTCSTS